MNSIARRSRGASNRMASTPSGPAARHDEPAEQGGRGVVRVALDVGRDAEQLGRGQDLAGEGVAGQHAAHGRGRGRAQAARQRDPVVHDDPPADALVQVAAGGAQRRLEAAHEVVVVVGRQLALALAVDGQVDLAPAPDPDLELDRVGHGEGQSQAVVAGAEVGRRGRHLDRDPAAVELGEPTCVHRPLPYQPSATATEPIGRRSLQEGQDLALGSARILEAVPGQHAHDGRRRVELAGCRGLGHAGHAGRGRRLAEDALVAREGPVGGRGSRRRSRR